MLLTLPSRSNSLPTLKPPPAAQVPLDRLLCGSARLGRLQASS